MRKFFLFVSILFASLAFSISTYAAVTYCAPSAFGYSTATGGGSATPVLVSSVSDLQKALNKGKNKVIIITANLTFTKMLSVQDGENVTLLGLPGVKLISEQQTASTSGILFVKRFNNLIIRNLTFVGPGAYDCDGNDLLCFENVMNAWVDHCDFQDGCDGNFDNKHNTDNVTVSWCRFRYLKAPKPGGSGGSDDHRFTNLLGSSSSDAPSDGTYNFTWAYCWWDEGCKERMVRCRNASLHFLNCYWNSSVANYYVGPENAKCLFDGCTFEGKANSSSKIFKSYGGTNACKFNDCEGNTPSNSGTMFTPEYGYSALGPTAAKAAVKNTSCGAGATLTVTVAGAVSSACDAGIDPTPVFTILWDATTNGGTCATLSTELEEGSAIGTLPVATKADCTFDGWFTQPSGGDMITPATIVTTSVTYYAQFTASGGGGGGGSECDKIFAFAYAADATTAGVTNSTATFSGFKTGSNNCSGSITIDGTTYSISKRGGNSTFSITFTVPAGKIGTLYGLANSNGDTQRTITLSNSASTYSATQTSSTSSSSAKAITYTDLPAGSYTLTTNGSASVPFLCLKLCDGVIDPVVLSYDENGGSGTMEDQTGATITVKANAFTAPTGYEFLKWNSEMNGSGTDYTVGQHLSLTESLTLYAIWQPKTYTVTLDKDGGSGGPASVTATFDDAMPSTQMPTKSGFAFLGYFTEKDGVGTQYYDANGNSTGNWTIASNTTLYAAWGPASTPEGDCNLKFWFFNSADATANSKTNDGSYFKDMAVTSLHSLEGSITIDGLSYSVTKRTDDPSDGVFGKFTVGTGKTAVFYALAVSSGSGDRQINLESTDATYELSVPGGSASYKRIESGVLTEGTYTIKRASGNVRLAVVVVKECAASSGTKKVYLKAPDEAGARFAVYCFDSGEKWYDMTLETDDECEGKIYSAEVDTKYTGYVFCRMNGSTTENNWDNKWNQTVNLDAQNIFFKVDAWNYAPGSTSACTESKAPFKVCRGGTWLRFAGETMTLNASCTGATHFQWYKGGTDESNKITGATDAIYTKICAVGDGGNYYCKAWTVAGEKTTSEALGVRVPYLAFQSGGGGDRQDVAFTRADISDEVASCTRYPGVAWDYEMMVMDGIDERGNTGTMTSNNCTNWTLDQLNNSKWCRIHTSKEGTYTFNLSFSNSSYTPLKLSVVYPPAKQTPGRPVYIENTETMGWNPDAIYYRIGKGKYDDGDTRNWTTAKKMTLVPGTARYFQTTTENWGSDFWAWHICNNKGDANYGNFAIYKTHSSSFYIDMSSNFSGNEIPDGGWTIYLNATGSTETSDPQNSGCTFFGYTHSPGMLTHSIALGATEHGQLQVNWIDVNSASQSSKAYTARTLADLAHTCRLTITGVPDNGYRLVDLKINGADHADGTEYILASDGKVVTATFTEATYSVTLNLNTTDPSASINSDNVTEYTFPESVDLPYDITRDGYEFLGWYDNAECTGTPVTSIPASSWGNKQYWAKWVAGKPSPIFTWDGETTLKAGGIYPVSVTTTGDANVTLSIVETIAGVTGSFTAGNPAATGTVTLGSYPAATTFTYQAHSDETTNFKEKTETQTVTIERCETYDIVSYAVDPIDTKTSKPRYYCEESGAGRIMKVTGNSSISTSPENYTGESWATKYLGASEHSIQAYQENVFKIVFYVKAGSNNTKISDLKYSDEYHESSGDWTDIKSSAQIIYNDDPAATALTKNVYTTLTIIPSSPMSKDGWLYFKLSSSTQVWGAKLYRPGGDEPTSIAFSGEPTIEKYPGDAAFTNTANQTTTPTLSGGSITYKSSDETVATVNAITGEVTPLAIGRTTITATLSAIGCFKAATTSYSLTVKKCTDPACTIAVTAGSANKCAGDAVTLTATAAAGATFQWYKGGVVISGENNPTLTTTEPGEYYATATRECLQKSNTIEVVNLSAPTATALHDYYYIKAGRVTPPIKLFQISNASSWTVTPAAPAGCAYELGENGIIYLTGTPSASLAAGNQEITVTAHSGCGYADAPAAMELRTLPSTAKPQIAWVADGTKGQTLPGTVTTGKSSNHALYKYLKDYFDLTSVNAYCTTEEKELSDYYSQFDLILLTDYPDTQVGPASDKDREHSYSNAIGCLIDEKPILSLEAFVAGCPNWGINTNPKTPKPDKQKAMTLLCSAHNIFAGTTISVGEKITVLESISGNGLQGFTGLDAPPGMLFIATIENSDAEGGTLVVCCERQKVIEARMMILGLNYSDMANLNGDGKLIIKQIILYLLQFTDIADCSMVFDNGVGNTSFNPGTYTGTGTRGDGKWSTAANWHPTYNAVPKPFQAVRVDKPCNVDIAEAHCSSVRLRKDGTTWNGKLTIQPDGALTVIDYIKEVHGTNYATTYPSAAADLVIQANTSGQNGSLVFGNTEDDLQATVEYYSLANGAKTSSPVWQYIGIPITDKPMAIDAYHAAWMCSWESEGTVSSNWVWVENEDKIQPFKGYCITQQTAKKYIHKGSLSRPEAKDLPLYYFTSPDGDGFNMFANSWVAPIDITKMETADFGGAAEATIFIYNTGSREQYDGGGTPSTAGTNTDAGQFNAIPVEASSYLAGSLTKIPTMQGFFVQATKEGTLTLDYKKICFDDKDFQTTAETMRAPKRRTKDSNVEKIVPEVMRLDVVSANWGDRLYILTHEEFSDAFDRGWDGSKQEGDAEAPMLALVRGNGLLAVAAVETAEERELSFRAGEDTEYTFHFNYEGETIYLYDRLADQAVEIKTGNTYSFTAENKTPAKRFIITKNPPRIPTDIENTTSGSQYSDAEKCIIDGQLYIIKNNRFYDARGVRVNSFKRKEVTP